MVTELKRYDKNASDKRSCLRPLSSANTEIRLAQELPSIGTPNRKSAFIRLWSMLVDKTARRTMRPPMLWATTYSSFLFFRAVELKTADTI